MSIAIGETPSGYNGMSVARPMLTLATRGNESQGNRISSYIALKELISQDQS